MAKAPAKTTSAPAPASVGVLVSDTITDSGADTMQGTGDDTQPPADVQSAASEEPQVSYPRRIRVINHGGIAIVEPITGAFIQAGGKAPLYLLDAEHEHRVMQNLRASLEHNNLPASALEFEAIAD